MTSTPRGGLHRPSRRRIAAAGFGIEAGAIEAGAIETVSIDDVSSEPLGSERA